jgi:hypothetical protein
VPSRSVCILIVLTAVAVTAHAQWINYPAPGTPRTRDGKPNLSAPAPRASNGKPDLSGVWQVEPTPAEEMKRLFGDLSVENVLGDSSAAYSTYLVNILVDFKPEESPLRPEFRGPGSSAGKGDLSIDTLSAGRSAGGRLAAGAIQDHSNAGTDLSSK